MSAPYNLQRFVQAQANTYATALAELNAGRKTSHWMWFIFPQVAGLGYSEMAQRYAIADLDEARAYVQHSVLGPRLIACSQALLGWRGRSARQILGSPDDLKLRSSMTLFALAAPDQAVFTGILQVFYGGQADEKTLALLGAGPCSEPADEQLIQAARQTLSHYELNAERFREGTRGHDVSQNIAALLRYIEAPAPWQILDVGCGPGRDLQTFTALGHIAVGLDGCERFVQMARTDSGCEVWLQDFLKLDLPAQRFDGVFANAALFHIPSQALPHALRQLYSSLKPGGVLLSSNPRGEDQEGWNGDRYGVYYRLETWQSCMQAAGFVELEHYYRPAGLPREQQPWLASVWRRPAA
ncbi:Uncharacterized protein, DUF1810 family [Halopseudomonas sabulinigri]|uniref:Uncharacterized protein, DUF1810 family n=1 Tax=Halopseudomonas sabulinigri TaxID=472181 RepID=A0A1H1ML70_9GAMM|nr:Uncharacterized protein, DUF1810 family [Halopseudomonas sabulinigri]